MSKPPTKTFLLSSAGSLLNRVIKKLQPGASNPNVKETIETLVLIGAELDMLDQRENFYLSKIEEMQRSIATRNDIIEIQAKKLAAYEQWNSRLPDQE